MLSSFWREHFFILLQLQRGKGEDRLSLSDAERKRGVQWRLMHSIDAYILGTSVSQYKAKRALETIGNFQARLIWIVPKSYKVFLRASTAWYWNLLIAFAFLKDPCVAKSLLSNNRSCTVHFRISLVQSQQESRAVRSCCGTGGWFC